MHLLYYKSANKALKFRWLGYLRYQYIQPTVSPPEISLSRDISTLIYLFISFSCYEPSVKCFIRLLICNSLPLLSALLGYKQSAHSSSMYFPASQESLSFTAWYLNTWEPLFYIFSLFCLYCLILAKSYDCFLISPSIQHAARSIVNSPQRLTYR